MKILDILNKRPYTTFTCRMKEDRPCHTAPRENAPRLKARLGMDGPGTTAGGHGAAPALQGDERLLGSNQGGTADVMHSSLSMG